VEDDHDHDHHDDFLQFSTDQINEYGVEVRQASGGTLRLKVRAPAEISLVTDGQAHILPKVSGIAVAAYKNLGEEVAAGELLATLESKEIAEAKSTYLTALKKEKLAAGIFNREAGLYEKKISSEEEYRNSENAKDEASIELELAKQKLITLGLNPAEIVRLSAQSPDSLRLYELRSPIAGKVVSRHLVPGEYVTSDREVFVVADLSKVWAEVNVFPNDRQHVSQGQPVTITGNDGRTAQGTVSYLSPVIDAETRTSTALVELENGNGQWLPGAFVQAEFITEELPVALLVPKDSVQNIDGTDIVFVSADGGFDIKPVILGKSDDEYCEVLSGLEPGSGYACTNTFLLKADLKKDEAEHMD
jgi:cobalt-zinc-cadmium efflux system membrane fusion protein